MEIRNAITILFLMLGFICFVITAIGVFRLKDFYSRLHAAGICEAAGLVLCSIGFFIYEGLSITGLKIFTVLMAVFIASPIGTHIIARVAFKQSISGDDDEIEESPDILQNPASERKVR